MSKIRKLTNYTQQDKVPQYHSAKWGSFLITSSINLHRTRKYLCLVGLGITAGNCLAIVNKYQVIW
jgi:hypothetical protein